MAPPPLVPPELALSSDSGPLCACAAWELQSGCSLGSFRGGGSGPRALALLGGEHLLGAPPGRNCINAWELRRPDQLQQKIVCPGLVTCLAASPNGLYIVAGIAESIYLWEVSSGNLLAILNRHYQDLTCICFTDDSSHFLSGAKDSLVLVWSLYSVLQTEQSQLPEPLHVWSRHTLPITDLHCGCGGALARAATVSLDQTAKLWSISSGDLLMSILFDVRIMAVTLDPSEYHMFCGGSDGSIFQVDLYARPVQRDRAFQTEKESGKTFKGHRDQVTCLSVSMDGTLLLSGSHDESVRLWDVQSKQCVRTVAHKGPVTNASIIPAPANLFSLDSRPSIPLPRFSKHLQGAESSDEPGSRGVTLRLGLHQQVQGPAAATTVPGQGSTHWYNSLTYCPGMVWHCLRPRREQAPVAPSGQCRVSQNSRRKRAMMDGWSENDRLGNGSPLWAQRWNQEQESRETCTINPQMMLYHPARPLIFCPLGTGGGGS